MKHKVNKEILRRELSLILIMIMLVAGLKLNMNERAVYAAEKAKNDGNVKDYIIVTENKKAYNRTLSTIDEGLIENEEEFTTNNIIVAKLSEQEAEELNKDKNIIIEENLTLEANSAKQGSKSKKELYKRIKNSRKKAKEKRETEWNLQAINVDEVDTNTKLKNKIKIAVLDSGVDFISGMNLVESVNFVETEEYVVPYY